MELDPEICSKLAAIDWFSRCGSEPVQTLPFQFQRASDIAAAITHARGLAWRDAGTAAQGDLTGFLAKHHYECYAGHWNRLGDAVEDRMQREIMPTVKEALANLSAEVLSDLVLLDLNRIAIHSAYSKRFKRLPDFFQRLLVVYERGHLPCGWIGDLDLWPEGELLIY